MRVPGRRKDIQGIGRPEMQQEETEVWKAAATSTIYYTRSAFSNNFAKFEGKTDTIKALFTRREGYPSKRVTLASGLP